MKKILIILTKLYMGGFSKSLINLLLCADNRQDVSFSLLCLDNERMPLEKDLPNGVEIIRVHDAEFKENSYDKLRLFYHKCKYVFVEKCSQIVKHVPIPYKYVTEYAQIKNYIKAKSLQYDFGFANTFDAVISWEECYCNYVLSEKIPARRKIGFIHPNYLEAHFCKEIDRKSLKKMDGIITISESCYDTLCNVFPEFRLKIHCIPNRLYYRNLVTKSQEYAVDFDRSCTSLLTVARIVDHDKAIFRIVKLAKKLRECHLYFRWFIIGNGSDFEEMTYRIANEGLSENVILLGELANPCPYMKAVDLFVMQSHREGRPVAVDEALLLGTPALITNYSSAHEQIDNNVTGWIVDDNFDSIFLKLNELLSNPELVNEASKNIVFRIDRTKFEDCSELICAALGSDRLL